MNNPSNSTLYLVSTPIGNLSDITFRAIETLKNVDIIACEDTRHSLKLLNHYKISKKLISYHSHNKEKSSKGIIKLLKEGKSVALITDSGTPCISDPGIVLVNKCLNENINITPIPGPSAFTTLLSASGMRSDKFFFHGFLSPKKGRQTKQLLQMKNIEATHIIYESPYRILKLLENINKIFLKKELCIGKELTKINEKVIRGYYETIIEEIVKQKIAGEYVILIANY
jgi:16S rRNA (cytidine1402-2'-O)-methyltransferase